MSSTGMVARGARIGKRSLIVCLVLMLYTRRQTAFRTKETHVHARQIHRSERQGSHSNGRQQRNRWSYQQGPGFLWAELVVLDLPARNDDAASTIKEIERDGGSGSFQEVDVRDPKSISQAVSAVADRHGKLDIMVNNAGLVIRRKALDLSQEEWDTVQEINLRGVFFGCQAAAKAMIKGGGGKIVNTASELAFVTPRAGINATYIASKLGSSLSPERYP